MANRGDDSPQWKETQRKLADFLGQLEELKPRRCTHGDYAECMEGCTMEDTGLAGIAHLSEFILVSSWTDMETGQTYISWMSAENQVMSHTVGLLHTALFM
jgi:hypothetical protein